MSGESKPRWAPLRYAVFLWTISPARRAVITPISQIRELMVTAPKAGDSAQGWGQGTGAGGRVQDIAWLATWERLLIFHACQCQCNSHGVLEDKPSSTREGSTAPVRRGPSPATRPRASGGGAGERGAAFLLQVWRVQSRV